MPSVVTTIINYVLTWTLTLIALPYMALYTLICRIKHGPGMCPISWKEIVKYLKKGDFLE